MSESSIKEYFSNDHDRLDNLFKRFQDYKKNDFSKAKEFFKEFKNGLQRHIVWEEDVLFPVFEKKSGMTSTGPTFVMRNEHRQIKEHLENIHKRVQKNDPSSDSDENALFTVLSQHNLKEENVLYPSIDNLTDEKEKKEIFTSIKNIPEERYKHCCQNH